VFESDLDEKLELKWNEMNGVEESRWSISARQNSRSEANEAEPCDIDKMCVQSAIRSPTHREKGKPTLVLELMLMYIICSTSYPFKFSSNSSDKVVALFATGKIELDPTLSSAINLIGNEIPERRINCERILDESLCMS
jgi:hypothetical protein